MACGLRSADCTLAQTPAYTRHIKRSWLSKHILLGLGHFLPSCFPSTAPPRAPQTHPSAPLCPLPLSPDTCVPSLKQGGEFLISRFTAPSSLVTQSLGAELLASAGRCLSAPSRRFAGQRHRVLSVLSQEAGKGRASRRGTGSIPKSKERQPRPGACGKTCEARSGRRGSQGQPGDPWGAQTVAPSQRDSLTVTQGPLPEPPPPGQQKHKRSKRRIQESGSSRTERRPERCLGRAPSCTWDPRVALQLPEPWPEPAGKDHTPERGQRWTREISSGGRLSLPSSSLPCFPPAVTSEPLD